MKTARLSIGAVLALGAAAVQAAASGEPPAASPAARASTILAGRLDGRSARIRHLHSAQGCAALETGVRAVWQQASAQPVAGLPVLETRAGPWRILSRLAADGLQVLQLQPLPAGHCEGLLTHWPSDAGPRASLPSGWPPAIRVLHRIETGGQHGRDLTVLARAPGSPEYTLAALQAVLRPLGLNPRPIAAPPTAPPTASGGGAYTAESARAQVALYLEAGDGFTHIVLMLQGEWS